MNVCIARSRYSYYYSLLKVSLKPGMNLNRNVVHDDFITQIEPKRNL